MLQVYRLKGDEDLQQLRSELDKLTDIHPTLRCTYSSRLQFSICERADYELDEVTLLAADETVCAGLVELPIDLSVAPFRARMYCVGGRAVFLALSFEHIVLDGPSQQVVYGHLTGILAERRADSTIRIPLHSESKIGGNAIAHHVRALRATTELELMPSGHRLWLPFEVHLPSFYFSRSWHVSKETVSAAEQAAQKMGVTLNAFVFGTLAQLLSKCSGQYLFAVGQTYQGRHFEDLQVVGSFSTIVPLHFDFSDDPSLLDICRHVLSETQHNLGKEHICEGEQPPAVAYEFTDLRPMRRPAEHRSEVSPFPVGLFFFVCQFADGFSAMVMYDAGKYDDVAIESFVEMWVDIWRNASKRQGNID